MRWFIGILIALNLGILAWGWLGEDKPTPADLAAPDVGDIKLVGEPAQPPAATAVPIPAPPRDNGALPSPRPPSEEAGASAKGAQLAAAPEAAPLPAEPEPVTEPGPVTEPEAPAPQTAIEDTPAIREPEPAYVPEPIAPSRPARQVCQRIGPFTSQAEAQPTVTALAKRGTVMSVRAAGQVPAGYWVLVPPQPSRAVAVKIAEQLRAKGIKDLWIVSSGEARNGISLGVFSEGNNADRFAAKARAMGFTVEIRRKTKPGQQTWLNYQGARALGPSDIPKTSGVGIAPRDCP